jgi:hypothetical protein
MAPVSDEMNSHRVAWFLSSIGAALAVVLIQSCRAGGGWVDPPFHPIQPFTVALPYVEAVHFPFEIHAWRPFTIELELSCAQFPDALRSPARPFPDRDLVYGGNEEEPDHFVGMLLYRDVTQINQAEPQRSRIVFDIRGLSAGQHSVSFVATRTRTQGGMLIQLDGLTWQWLGGDLGPIGYEILFTVLP